MLCVIVNVALGVTIPFITRFVVDALAEGDLATSDLLKCAGLYFAASVLGGFFALRMRRLLLNMSHDVGYALRRDVFAHLTTLDHQWYQGERTGDIMTKMTSDLNAVREFLGQGLLQGTRTVVGFTLAFSVMFFINVKLALIMLGLMPCLTIIFFLLLRLVRKRYEQSQEQFSEISNFIQESFDGIRTIKGFGAGERKEAAFKDLNQEYIARKMAQVRVERPLWPMMGLLFSIGLVLILLSGGRMVIDKELTLGQLVQFIQYLYFLQWPMVALGWTMNLVQRGQASWIRLRTILDATSVVQTPEVGEKEALAETLEGDIVFENVNLAFGNQSVLSEIDLRIPKNATVGITGPTGSGKTLLVSLIPRLIDPTSGTIKIGKHNVAHLDLQSLRQHIGMAPQEPFLFSDTLENNIAFGVGGEYTEKVLWAADVAQLRDEAEDFPDGFKTFLGERGVTLSGGQRQRTAISRAIARSANILILDDIFSAIDTETEARILNQLNPILHKRTTLLISHRVTTLREADFIVVLEQGRITQLGPHADLIQQPGYYQDLHEMQQLAAHLESP